MPPILLRGTGGVATAATRGRNKQFLNAEDAVALGGEHVFPDPEPVARIGRAHRNDLENLLLFAILAGLYLALGGARLPGQSYCGAFLLARFCHALAYLRRMHALRRNGYALGFLTIVAMAVHVAWLAIAAI